MREAKPIFLSYARGDNGQSDRCPRRCPLAAGAHHRWKREREAAGWTQGDPDPINKRSPYLVPWEVLDEQVKEFDREAVQAIPEALALIGMEIVEKPSKNG